MKRILSVFLTLCVAVALLCSSTVAVSAAALPEPDASAYWLMKAMNLPAMPFQYGYGLMDSGFYELRLLIAGEETLEQARQERRDYNNAAKAYAAELFTLGKAPAVTRAQEKAVDLKLQENCFALLKEKQFNQATWESSSVRQKKAALGAFFIRVQKIMKTSVEPEIRWEAMDGTISAFYDPKTNQITVNEIFLGAQASADSGLNTAWPEAYATVMHEIRHAYQNEAVKNLKRHTVSLETRSWWAWNNMTAHYIDGSSQLSNLAYAAQPIEYDAFAFEDAAVIYEGYTIKHSKSVIPLYNGSW
jgi:hypothetical protein